jgi:hypothetical protein
MNFFNKKLLLLSFFALFMFVSCDDEQIDNNLLNDVETILPNSELATMMQDVASVEVFECVAFQYPISFSLYDTDFQVLETITINSDSELLVFFESLNSATNNVVLMSLNFPVTLIYDNSTSIAVQNNQELEAALTAASDNCESSEACDIESVTNYLINCSQIPTLNTFTPSFTEFEFSENNDLSTMYELDLPHWGTWDIAVIESEVVVFINFNGLEDYNGEWVVISCNENSLVMMQDNDTLILTQSCDTEDPLECFGSFEAQMTLCDENNDGVETFNLTQVFANCTPNESYNLLYYESLADAQSSSNQIPNPESFTNTSNSQTIYVKVEFEGTVTSDVFEIQLLLEDCNCENPGFLTNDLIIYMPFSNEAINLIDDSSAENLPINFVEDRNGNTTCAVAFDGTNHLTIPINDNNQLVQGDAFTVSIWFKMQNTVDADYEGLFQKGPTTNDGFQLVVYDLNTPLFGDSTFNYGLWDNDWNQETDVEWENTNWHHLVVTVDTNNTVRLYRDGLLRNVDENSSIDIGSTPLENYFIGLGLQGHLDDLRVYKRALSPNEVGDLYNLDAECFTCF